MPYEPLAGFIYALVALLVIIDPPGTAVIFAGMTTRDSPTERKVQAIRACIIAYIVLAAFGLGGGALLSGLGIGLPAMKVAGGILLFIAAADMVTARGTTARGALRGTRDERAAAMQPDQDISVFPLAIPLIAGPGAMTTMVLLRSQAGQGWVGSIAIQLALLVALLVTLGGLLMARWIARLLGETGASVFGRVLGVILAALAAQITLDGVRQSLGSGG